MGDSMADRKLGMSGVDRLHDEGSKDKGTHVEGERTGRVVPPSLGHRPDGFVRLSLNDGTAGGCRVNSRRR